MLHLSVFKTAYFVNMQSGTVLEDGQDDAETDSRFRSGYDHHEERVDVAIHLFELVRECYEAKVHGVQHQLDRHEDRDDVLAEQESGDTEREQDRR
jgi:predicted RNA-binding Zn ribbon-like protein